MIGCEWKKQLWYKVKHENGFLKHFSYFLYIFQWHPVNEKRSGNILKAELLYEYLSLKFLKLYSSS